MALAPITESCVTDNYILGNLCLVLCTAINSNNSQAGIVILSFSKEYYYLKKCKCSEIAQLSSLVILKKKNLFSLDCNTKLHNATCSIFGSAGFQTEALEQLKVQAVKRKIMLRLMDSWGIISVRNIQQETSKPELGCTLICCAIISLVAVLRIANTESTEPRIQELS